MRSILIASSIIALSNTLILGIASVVRQSVVDSWRKGPLIDPAAPYAPENAQWLVAISLCAIVNLYFIGLLSKKFRQYRWAPMVLLLAAISFAEAGLQLHLNNNQQTLFRPHPTLHWAPRANLTGFTDRTGATISTNNDGFRTAADHIKKPNSYRIVVLGDSSNFGHGVSATAMWSAQLEKLLSAHSKRRIEVINAACPGWTTWQGRELLETTLKRYQPDLVIAGFNNDSGPDFMSDRQRVPQQKWVRALNAVLFKSELYLLGREAVLSIFRRFSSRSQRAYQQRLAGERSNYGALKEGERETLVPRVSLDELKQNMLAMRDQSMALGASFVWINMPVNRRETELVNRYVDWRYRDLIREHSGQWMVPVIDVDARWQSTREDGLHIFGHVFHPNAIGHRRLAEQVAAELIGSKLIESTGRPQVGGPEPAATPRTLRLGWSSNTPLHALLGSTLELLPELAKKHGIELELRSFSSGKAQGRALANQEIDAWFSCGIPAIHMLSQRPDAKIVAGLGSLGQIALLSQHAQLNDVGLVLGSSPELFWKGLGLDAQVHDIATTELERALSTQRVDAVVSWDPWISQWQRRHPEWQRRASEEFHSVLIVDHYWALAPEESTPPVERLLQLFSSALRQVAENPQPHLERVAELGGWSIEDVQAVLAYNDFVREPPSQFPELSPRQHTELRQAWQAVRPKNLAEPAMFGMTLRQGELAPPTRKHP